MVAALVLSPVVWMHYLALLLIPLAVMRPTFDRVWFWGIVCALWIYPVLPKASNHTIGVDVRMLTASGPIPTVEQLCLGLGFMAFVALATRSRREAHDTRAHPQPS